VVRIENALGCTWLAVMMILWLEKAAAAAAAAAFA